MFQKIRDWLYDIVASSGILFYLLPILKPFYLMSLSLTSNNAVFTDDGGATLKVFKYQGTIFPRFGTRPIKGIKSLRIRKDDVILCSYPKAGCHWTHEILHMLVTGKAEMTKHGKEFGGFLEMMSPILIDSLPSPRVLNTHVLYHALPEQVKARRTKIIVTMRNPKDTVVSFYNHLKALSQFYQYDGTFENFFKLFMKGEVEYGDYFDAVLDWEKVVKSQNDNPILLVEYEKLKKNPLEAVKEMARFLGVDVTDGFVSQVVEVTKFSNMKAKQKTNNKLLRKGAKLVTGIKSAGKLICDGLASCPGDGIICHFFRFTSTETGISSDCQVGDWRNWLTEAQSKQIDQVWKDRMLDCDYQPDLS